MRTFFFAALLFCFGFSMAQPPAGYYDEAEGLSGYALKTALSEITGQGYDQQSYGALWTYFNENDLDNYYENDGTILDVYSEDPDGEDPYNFTPSSGQCGSAGYSQEGDCYNREHLMPQSWFDKGLPMRTDVNHIFPVDGYVNAQHGNMPFGEVDNPNYTSLNGSKKGPNSYDYPDAYTGEVFEPIDEFKGDIARAYLYMAMRYEDQIANWYNYTDAGQKVFDGSSDQVYQDWTLSMFLKWHQEDPVSQRELDRNNATYEFQGNRNPFIDHPEYVDMIWDMDNVQPSEYLFEEDFDSCELVADQFMTVSEMSDADWHCVEDGGQNNTGGMQMNGFIEGENEPSKDWLITTSPLSFEEYTNEELSFYVSSKFGNTPLQVLYSVDYDGGENPSQYDWYTIPGVSIPIHSGNDQVEHNFSGIDLSLIAENDFYLAFRYDNSNGQDATLWVVDNIRISGVDKELSIPTHTSWNVSVYPNPVNWGEVTIELPEAQQFTYKVYDLTGRKLIDDKAENGRTRVSTDALQQGVYMVRIQSGDQQTVKRLIVN